MPVGELACSGQQQLATANAECFTRGSSNDFELSLPHMGPLHELHVCHNGTTPSADWHLDLVIVADSTTGDRCYSVVSSQGMNLCMSATAAFCRKSSSLGGETRAGAHTPTTPVWTQLALHAPVLDVCLLSKGHQSL